VAEYASILGQVTVTSRKGVQKGGNCGSLCALSDCHLEIRDLPDWMQIPTDRHQPSDSPYAQRKNTAYDYPDFVGEWRCGLFSDGFAPP